MHLYFFAPNISHYVINKHNIALIMTNKKFTKVHNIFQKRQQVMRSLLVGVGENRSGSINWAKVTDAGRIISKRRRRREWSPVARTMTIIDQAASGPPPCVPIRLRNRKQPPRRHRLQPVKDSLQKLRRTTVIFCNKISIYFTNKTFLLRNVYGGQNMKPF